MVPSDRRSTPLVRLRYARRVADEPLPFTPMQIAATALHELFATLTTVGFTEQQALVLISALVERTADADN